MYIHVCMYVGIHMYIFIYIYVCMYAHSLFHATGWRQLSWRDALSLCVAMCCNVLRCVGVLQRDAVCCSMLQ